MTLLDQNGNPLLVVSDEEPESVVWSKPSLIWVPK